MKRFRTWIGMIPPTRQWRGSASIGHKLAKGVKPQTDLFGKRVDQLLEERKAKWGTLWSRDEHLSVLLQRKLNYLRNKIAKESRRTAGTGNGTGGPRGNKGTCRDIARGHSVDPRTRVAGNGDAGPAGEAVAEDDQNSTNHRTTSLETAMLVRRGVELQKGQMCKRTSSKCAVTSPRTSSYRKSPTR